VEPHAAGLIIATTPELEGRPVRDYLGIVSGEAAVPVGFEPSRAGARRARARSASFEQRMHAARERAIAAMAEAAVELGAHAVLAVEVRSTTVRRTRGGELLIVTVTGTAVTL
jgi:uncharacterized protein YbjQ (UPF0145 family)